MATTHCLELGGAHAEAGHLRLMLDCAEICRVAAHFMLAGSPYHAAICAACAPICHACAQSCEEIGDMEECVQVCRACTEACARMANAADEVTS